MTPSPGKNQWTNKTSGNTGMKSKAGSSTRIKNGPFVKRRTGKGRFLRFDLNSDKIIFSLICAVMGSAAVMNIINSGTQNYLSLAFSGFYMLLPHIALVILFFLLCFVLNEKYTSLLTSVLWLFFLSSMLLFPSDEIPWAGIALLSSAGLYISFMGLKERFLRRNILGILISSGYIALIIYSALRIPFSEIYDELLQKMNVNASEFNTVFYISAGIFIVSFILLMLFKDRVTKRQISIIAWVVFIIQAVVVGRLLYFRFLGLNTPTYDFNLFAQMFHSMSETLKPVTTLERNMPLSHFKVHISPIYYLMLPFYAVTKDPGVLQILQAVIVASGVFPVVMMCRRFALKGTVTVAVSLLFMVFPAFILSSFYDLHENCFLVPLILWLLYFNEKDSFIMTLLFAILILMVKEDASIYLWTISLFIMLENKKRKEGLILFLLTTAYFIWAIMTLKSSGEGAMLGRFDNMISIKNLSILSVPFTVLKNPGFFLKTVFSKEKTVYILQTLLPLGLTPLLGRKYSRFILLIPYIVMNLISDYPYQSNIRFQYNYGSLAIMFYLLLLFLKDREETSKYRSEVKQSGRNQLGRLQFTSSFVMALSLSAGIFFTSVPVIQYEYFVKYYRENKDNINRMKSIMDQIPEDASVTAFPFLTGYLSNRDTLYDTDYNVKEDNFYRSDYIVFDLRPGYNGKDPDGLLVRFLSSGYEIGIFNEKSIAVLYRTGSSQPPIPDEFQNPIPEVSQ